MVGIAHSAGIVGLDISDHVLRLAMVRGSGRKLRLVAAADIAVPEGTIVHGDIAKPDVVVNLVRQLHQRAGRAARSARHCVASLPEPTSFLKLLQVTPSAVADLGHEILAEAANHLPMATDEAYIDWQLLSPAGAPGQATVLVAATPRQTADQYLDILNRAGLDPIALELEPVAIGRAVLADGAAAAGTVAVLDLGGTRASYTVFRAAVPQFTVSLPVASSDWTGLVSRALQLDAAQAEEAKLRCGLNNPSCDGAVADALAEPLQELARRLQEALGYYQGHLDATRPVERTLLTGGGSQLRGLTEYLTPLLGHPVQLAEPLAGIATRQFKLTPAQGLRYATAIGLARRTTIPVQV